MSGPQLTSTDGRWWRAAKEDVARSLAAKLMRIRENQRPRRQMYQYFASLYGGQDVEGLGLTSYDVTRAASIYVPPSQPFNVTRSSVETIVARIAKERPLPQVTTEQGDYSAWKKSKRMTKALEGGFEFLKVFRTTPCLARDACTFGTGVAKLWREDDKPCIERVFPWEIVVDIADARYGAPRSMYYQKWYDKGVLLDRAEAWGASADALDTIITARSDGSDFDDQFIDEEDRYDRVMVTECWHLRSGPKAKDGRHVIALANAASGQAITLVDEPYERDVFPFVFLKYKEPLAGFWGDSLAQEMSGYQIEINLVSERVRSAHYMVGTGMWLVPEGSDVMEQDLDNSVAPIVYYKPGFKPEHINPDPVSPQTYQWLMDLRQIAPQDSGINEQAMHGTKPPGIIAAKALQSLKDDTSERSAMFSQAWDALHEDIGNHLVDMFCDIAEEHKDFSLRTKTRRGFKQYTWTDVALPRDAFSLSTQATSMLAHTPSGRLQQVYDLFNSKVISRVLFLKLLDAPDIDAETDLESAPAALVDEQIETMLDSDDPQRDYQSPLPIMDLTYALHRAQCSWAFAKMRGAPDDVLDMLVDYMDDCRSLLDDGATLAADQAAPIPLPGQEGLPGMPPAGPNALPPPPPPDAMGGGGAPMPPGMPLQ